MPVCESSACGGVCECDVFSPLRSRGERASGVGARRGLCEGMREIGGGAVTDGGLRVLGRGSFGALCCGVGAAMKGSSATASGTDEASPPSAEIGECGVGVVAGAWQQQAAAEHEPACRRGWCGRGRGVRACVRELSVWGRV